MDSPQTAEKNIPVAATASAAAKTPAVEFLDLRAQFATIRDEVLAAVAKVMESQYFILGPEVKQFEDEIAAKLGARFAIGCASGTDALILALLAAGIGPGDEVIVPSMTFISTATSVLHVGARPVFAEVTEDTFNLDPSDPSGNTYRAPASVGIEPTSDAGGGYDVGYTKEGEWLRYTVNIAQGGIVNLQARVASLGQVSSGNLVQQAVLLAAPQDPRATYRPRRAGDRRNAREGRGLSCGSAARG